MSSEKYGCFNRTILPIYIAPNREYTSPVNYHECHKNIQHTMTTDCKYDKSITDQRCNGCKHANQ